MTRDISMQFFFFLISSLKPKLWVSANTEYQSNTSALNKNLGKESVLFFPQRPNSEVQSSSPRQVRFAASATSTRAALGETLTGKYTDHRLIPSPHTDSEDLLITASWLQ